MGDNNIDPAKLRGYRARLNKLYSKYNPNKLDEIDEILLKYRGREKELFKKLHLKYVKPNKKVKEKERQRRKEKRKKDRNGEDYYDDDEFDEDGKRRNKYKKIFGDESGDGYSQDVAPLDGIVELVDDIDTEE